VHNFLVAGVGVVVHNSCIDALFDFYKFMFRNPDGVAHILRGKVNSAGLGTGCHHKSAFDMGTARIRPGSATTPPNSPFADADGWVDCVWHHHEDAKTMLPVPIQTHNKSFPTGSAHTGGATILKNNTDLIGFFNSPSGI